MGMLRKVFVIFIILCISFSYVFNLSVSLAEFIEEDDQSKLTSIKQVSFDVFLNKNDDKKYVCENSIKNGGKIFVSIHLNEAGWISDGKLEFKNSNFEITQDEENKSQFVKSVEDNVVYLNNISYGQDVEIELDIEFEKSDKISVDYLDRETEVNFSAVYKMDEEIENVTAIRHVQNIWKEESLVNTNLEITKTFSLNSGFMVEATLNTEVQDDILPRKDEKIELTAPVIENGFPDSVYVIFNEERLSDDNVSYDKTNGKLAIENKIEENNNEIEWTDSKNEYKIVFRYLNNISYVGKNIVIKGEINTQLLSDENIKNTIDNEFVLEEKGKVISVNSETTESIYKGYLYANSKYDTEFKENFKIEIANVEDLQNIDVNLERARFANDIKDVMVNDVVLYKNTKINKEGLVKILGNQGLLEVYDQNNSLITTITKDSQQDENGDIVINYSEGQNNIRLVFVNPEREGSIQIRNEKIVKGNTGFTENELKEFTRIKNNVAVQGISLERIENTVNVLDTEYKLNTQMSNTELSTIEENKDIDIIGVLKTDNNRYRLYENPEIQIIFPVEVTDVNVNTINLLYENELKIVNAHKEKNQAGNIIIVLNLEGKQTDYQISEIAEGANIVLNCSLTLDEKATNKEEKINYLVLQGEDVIQNEINVTYKAPKEVTSVDKITGSNQDEEAKTLMGKGMTVKLDVAEKEKILTFENSIMNFNEKAIENVSILGQMPIQGEKEEVADEENSVNSARNVDNIGDEQIDFTLEQPLQIEENVNAQIYYSVNENATKDLIDTNNGWSQNPEGAKMYLIVIPDGMQSKEILDINFKVKAPENLDYNKTSQYEYDVYYTLEGEEKKYEVEPITLTTGNGPDLDVSLTSIQSEKVYQEQMMDFVIKVTNNSDEVAENIALTISIPEGANYVKFEQSNSMVSIEELEDRQINWTIEKLDPGETYEETYNVVAKENETIKDLNFSAQASVEGFDKKFNSNELNFIVEDASISVRKESMYPEETNLSNEMEIQFGIYVKNIKDEAVKNIKIEDIVPEGIDFRSAYYLFENPKDENDQITYEMIENDDYDAETKKVTWNIEELQPNEERKVLIVGTVNCADKTHQFKNSAVAILEDGKQIPSNTTINNKTDPQLTIEKSSSVENLYIKENQEFSYYITVTNIGPVDANVELIDNFPEGTLPKQLIYSLNGQEQVIEELENRPAISIRIDIPVGGVLNIEVKVQTDILLDEEEEREIINKAILDISEGEQIESNEVVHIIELDPTLHPDDGDDDGEDDDDDDNDGDDDNVDDGDDNNDDDNTNDENKYKLAGMAWLDRNQNGVREDDEVGVSQVFVQLLNARTNQFVHDSEGNLLTAVTDINGNYTFEDLPNGDYIVIFVYDTVNYKTTVYQKSGASALVNSDAIDKNVNYQGTEQLRGVTDIISIDDISISNIDIGLVERAKFDLQLTKDINQIKIQTGNSVSVYKGNSGMINKIEIDGKKINQTNVEIDYVIKIKNNGDIAGYAKEIWDYLPEQLEYNMSQNTNWKLQNGRLVSNELENVIIEPGEEREIHLILTKDMKDDNVGTIINVAEIGVDYNERGTSDLNSEAGNNNPDENDYGMATLIIGIKTGKEVFYIGITLVSIFVIGIGVYFIKKKVIG